MSIKALNVVKVYGKQKALDNVSFEAHEGEIIGFIGPNGAGKSTMMKIITGYIPQTSGVVAVAGIDVVENPVEVKKLIGYLPEHNPLYLNMYIKEYLHFVAGIYGTVKNPRERIAEMIELTGLQHEQHKQIGALSKGYRQRVGLAQAMIHNPKILILDEPTTGLDPNQIVEIRELIKNVGRDKTVLLSTHIMQEVEAICQRIIVINKGALVADTQTADIQNVYAKTQTIFVEFNTLVDEADLLKIPEIISLKKLDTCKWLIETTEKGDLRETIFKFAVQNNIMVLSMQKHEQKLEDVFRSITT